MEQRRCHGYFVRIQDIYQYFKIPSIVCVFLFWWRLKDFKFTLLNYQPYAVKPIITRKVAHEKDLTIEDLNFIYERPIEYELDSELMKIVEEYRKSKGLGINPNYTIEAKKNYVENMNRIKFKQINIILDQINTILI